MTGSRPMASGCSQKFGCKYHPYHRQRPEENGKRKQKVARAHLGRYDLAAGAQGERDKKRWRGERGKKTLWGIRGVGSVNNSCRMVSWVPLRGSKLGCGGEARLMCGVGVGRDIKKGSCTLPTKKCDGVSRNGLGFRLPNTTQPNHSGPLQTSSGRVCSYRGVDRTKKHSTPRGPRVCLGKSRDRKKLKRTLRRMVRCWSENVVSRRQNMKGAIAVYSNPRGHPKFWTGRFKRRGGTAETK